MIKRIILGFLMILLFLTPSFGLRTKNEGMIKGWRVVLRSGPGKKYAKINTLYQGYAVKILKRHGSWYKVAIIDPPDGGQGWVHRRLVRVE